MAHDSNVLKSGFCGDSSVLFLPPPPQLLELQYT